LDLEYHFAFEKCLEISCFAFEVQLALAQYHVQTKTLNFSFAWQVVIVYFDAKCRILRY